MFYIDIMSNQLTNNTFRVYNSRIIKFPIYYNIQKYDLKKKKKYI